MEAEPDRPFAPGGDSWNGFHGRVAATLDRLAREYEGRTVVAVCHAGVIMASMRLLLGILHADISAQLRPTNTGLTEWEHEDDQLDAPLLQRGRAPPRPRGAQQRCAPPGVAGAQAGTARSHERPGVHDRVGPRGGRPRRPRRLGQPLPRQPGQRQPRARPRCSATHLARGWVRWRCRSTSWAASPDRPATRCSRRSTTTSGATTSRTSRRSSTTATSRRRWSPPTRTATWCSKTATTASKRSAAPARSGPGRSSPSPTTPHGTGSSNEASRRPT